jgi:hypothetical protein
MKLALCLAVVCLASCAASPVTRSEETSTDVKSHRISIYLGARQLDEDDYEPAEDQAMLGAEFAFERPGSSVGFEIGLMGSVDEGEALGFDVEANTSELYAGIRKTFGSGVVRPVLGAGVSYIHSEFELSGVGSDDDASIAGYVHGAVLFDISRSFFLGVDVRFLLGSDLEIAGVDTDADYAQYALVLGFAL